MAFNPNDHMMPLKGKDYLQVAWRLVWFREDHPDWCIDPQIVEHDADHAIFRAVICDENGVQKCAGHGSESKKDFGDFLEKAETKAVGRALAMLGYGTQFAADELDEGERIVDSPIERARNDENSQEKPKAQKPVRQVVEDRTSQILATDDQKRILRNLVNLTQLDACNRSYGENWERMPANVAEALIAKCHRMKAEKSA